MKAMSKQKSSLPPFFSLSTIDHDKKPAALDLDRRDHSLSSIPLPPTPSYHRPEKAKKKTRGSAASLTPAFTPVKINQIKKDIALKVLINLKIAKILLKINHIKVCL
jgi:hypothetical protein